MTKKSLKGTWPQALLTFFIPILSILVLRWLVLEPFVIPSESMVPNLLKNDHVFVFKSSLGIRLPFTRYWLMKWSHQPQRGDVLVFKYPPNPNVYFIKRLIGLPGDEVEVIQGRVTVNGADWDLEVEGPRDDHESPYAYFRENSGAMKHRIRFVSAPDDFEREGRTFKVPEGQYFFMGDNRDESSDSRVWGFVPEENLIGHAWLIWLSCDRTLASASYLCDFSTLRTQRLFQKIQ